MQCSSLSATTAEGAGSLPSQGAKIPHAMWCSPQPTENSYTDRYAERHGETSNMSKEYVPGWEAGARFQRVGHENTHSSLVLMYGRNQYNFVKQLSSNQK